jgi:hypothetical protein
MHLPPEGGSHEYIFESMFMTRSASAALVVIIAGLATSAPRAQQRPVFRSDLNVISVDVIVRDGSGAVVRGLTAADFEVKEDGRAQQVASFSFEEITEHALPALATAELLAGIEVRMTEASR